MDPEKCREMRLGGATVSASECRPATSLDSTASRFTTLGVHSDRTSHLTAGGGTATCSCDPTEGAGGRVGCDLLEAGPETFRRLEMCTLTPLLDPKASDAGSGDQEQDHDVDHALPPKTCLLLPRFGSFAELACERDAFTARCFRLTEGPMATARRSIPPIRVLNRGSCNYRVAKRCFFAVLKVTSAAIAPTPAKAPLVILFLSTLLRPMRT